jgi:hypothetical protein
MRSNHSITLLYYIPFEGVGVSPSINRFYGIDTRAQGTLILDYLYPGEVGV